MNNHESPIHSSMSHANLDFTTAKNNETKYKTIIILVLTGAETLESVNRTWGGGRFGCAGLPSNTTVSPLNTDCTLAKPVLGKMIGLVLVMIDE